MPDLDNPKPFIEFDNIGNNMYVPRFREGGLTPEVINSGDPKVLRAFFDEQGDKLHSDELAYLKARIVAADEIERLSSKASRDISQGKDHPVEPLDNNGGYTGFSNLKYPGEQTSANGCWSCAYSLILKSRGVQLSQEKIRAWRPSYSKTEDASSPAAQNLWYKRNADTDMEIPYNVDMLAQVLPNTSMVSYSMSPLSLENITLTDPRTGMPVEMTQQRATEIKNQHKRQAINNMRTTIENAIKVDKSPVAVVVDGHYITITGMDAQGRLRYEDSVYPVGQTTRYMTIEQLYHIGHERHRKKVDANTYVEVEPKGIAFIWIRDIDVPEYKQGEISCPDYKDNGDIIRVDAQGNASVAIPKNEKFRTSGGSLANGNLSTLGVMSSRNMDLKDLEDRLGVKINSFGVNGGYTLGNLDTYYPSKVLAKNDPKLAPENAITGDKTMRRFGSELVRLSQTEMKGKPWSGQLRDLGRSIVLLTNAGTSPEQRKAALETVKGLPAVLSLKDGSKSVLQTICDDAYSSDNWGEKGKLINNVNTLNNKLGLGMDVGAAMGKA
ncbi:MAG: hypothetical protein IJ129_03795, partial [Ruminococcus sp.]|nr:hypothetical protein [Ruminococcus sp.]